MGPTCFTEKLQFKIEILDHIDIKMTELYTSLYTVYGDASSFPIHFLCLGLSFSLGMHVKLHIQH